MINSNTTDEDILNTLDELDSIAKKQNEALLKTKIQN